MKCGLQMLFNRWFEKHLKASTTTFLPFLSKIQLGEKIKLMNQMIIITHSYQRKRNRRIPGKWEAKTQITLSSMSSVL